MEALEAARKVEAYSRLHDYRGYCKFDALNSPTIERLCGNFTVARIIATQVVNRVPLNLRGWLGVPKLRNPKGVANFIRGYCLETGQPHRQTIIDLSDWLLENTSNKLIQFSGSGIAWGYHFPWQSPGFFAPRHFPNCIVSTFCAEALLAAYLVVGQERYLQGAIRASDYLLKDLPKLESTPNSLCLSYVSAPNAWRVVNINAVVAGFISKLYQITGDPFLLETASRLINWVIQHQSPNGFWDYTSPYAQSGISADNYHTGGILDGIADFAKISHDAKLRDWLTSQIEKYGEEFFEADGAPKWRLRKSFPHDVHGSAQGILTLCRRESTLPKARTLLDWAVANLFDERDGRFYYQKHRFYTRKDDLMRWNNSWMFLALNSYIAAEQACLNYRLNKSSPPIPNLAR